MLESYMLRTLKDLKQKSEYSYSKQMPEVKPSTERIDALVEEFKHVINNK